MRILLFGRAGQLGRELCTLLTKGHELAAYGRDEVDVASAQAIRNAIRDARPELVVNAAAYTAVDAADTHVAEAMAVNAEAPRVIAEEAAHAGAALVHYSTDYVFDGESARPYVETDDTNPLGVYGASKLAGERAIYATRVPHLILRTSGVYRHAPGNFVTLIRRAAATQPELRVVTDQAGSPTFARTIARATHELLEQWQRADDARQGIYNLVSKGDPTRHALAVRIVELARERGETKLTARDVKPILTAELPKQGAPRPRYSALSTAKMERDFGIALPTWESDLAAYFASAA